MQNANVSPTLFQIRPAAGAGSNGDQPSGAGAEDLGSEFLAHLVAPVEDEAQLAAELTEGAAKSLWADDASQPEGGEEDLPGEPLVLRAAEPDLTQLPLAESVDAEASIEEQDAVAADIPSLKSDSETPVAAGQPVQPLGPVQAPEDPAQAPETQRSPLQPDLSAPKPEPNLDAAIVPPPLQTDLEALGEQQNLDNGQVVLPASPLSVSQVVTTPPPSGNKLNERRTDSVVLGQTAGAKTPEPVVSVNQPSAAEIAVRQSSQETSQTTPTAPLDRNSRELVIDHMKRPREVIAANTPRTEPVRQTPPILSTAPTPMPAVAPFEASAVPNSGNGTEPIVLGAETRGSLQAPASPALSAQAQPVAQPSWPQVAAQIAEVSRPIPNGPVEVSLQPEELGRLRLSFSTSEGGMTVTVSAERNETLDLLRRNISLLQEELQRFGFQNLSFAFSENTPGQDKPEAATTRVGISDTSDEISPTDPAVLDPSHALIAGLDIRL